jgi:hypothetical protein
MMTDSPPINRLNALSSDIYVKIVKDHLDPPSQVCLALTSKANLQLVTDHLNKSLFTICPPQKLQCTVGDFQHRFDHTDEDGLADHENLTKRLWTWMPLTYILCGAHTLSYTRAKDFLPRNLSARDCRSYEQRQNGRSGEHIIGEHTGCLRRQALGVAASWTP